MTFAEIKTEVKARGFEHLTDTLLNNMVNRAYADINDAYPWPYLTTTATGATPLTIANFAHALNVIDTTNKNFLSPEDPRVIYELDPTLIQTGNPDRWYWTGSAIATWPITTVQLSVRYTKVATDLTLDADTPIMPTRFQDTIVDGAVSYAHERSGDYDANARARFNDGVEQMAYALLVPNYDQANDIVVTGSTDW